MKGLVNVALFGVLAVTAQASPIVQYLGGTFTYAGFFTNGQSFTTPFGGPWNSITFNFYSNIPATTPAARGTAFLLSTAYSGTPAALSKSTPGLIATSISNESGIYRFDSAVTLQPNTQYWIYTNTAFSITGSTTAGTSAQVLYDSNGGPFAANPGQVANFTLGAELAPAVQPCTFTLVPASADFGLSGGSANIQVTASRSDCSTTATSDANWITFVNSTITGSTTVSYSVAANSGNASRTGTITIGGQAFAVTQGGPCRFTLPASSLLFGPAGGGGTASVQAPAGCAWTATSSVAWVTFTQPASGTGDGAVNFTVAANGSSAPLSTTLTIANLPFVVTELGEGSNQKCTASATAPQVALEGRTEVVGDVVLSCTGLSATLQADITLTLNANVTSADAILTVNGGSPQIGQVSGYNIVRWGGVTIAAAADGTATLRISKVRADASNLPAGPITGKVAISGLPPIPVINSQLTVANAAASLVFTKGATSPPAGGAQTFIPLMYREAAATSFLAGTRVRLTLSKIPATVQVYAPVFPGEGAARAQLYSADANGSGGSPLAGSAFAGGTYQQLTVNPQGAGTATWVVLSADAAQVETLTFPLLLLNATAGDLNQILVSGSLAPVSDVTIASATAPVPRYRDLSVAQKLVSLRVTTSIQNQGSAVKLGSSAGPHLAVAGSNVTFVTQIINDTSDPTQSATNLMIGDRLPSGLSLISCTLAGASCGGSGNQVQVNAGTLGPGQSMTVTVVARVDSSAGFGAVLENAISASSDQVSLDLFASTASASFVVLGGAPVAVGGTPASGGGSNQSFTFQFSYPSGYQNLGVVNVLINSFLDGRKACYLAYVVQSKTLVLVNDAGNAGGQYAGAVALGDSSVIENSQCTVSLSSASGSGTTLTLVLSIGFKASFGGNKVTYVAARDTGAGSTDWQALGVWQAPFTPSGAITVTGVSPSRGVGPAGTNKQFQFTLTDSKGTGDFGIVNILINNFIDGRKACYLAYAAPSNTLMLVNDAGDAGGPFAGSLVLGTNGGIENGQCQVNGVGSAVGYSPNTMTLILNITFKEAITGNRVMYVAGRDRSEGNNTDWQAVGTWTVQ